MQQHWSLFEIWLYNWQTLIAGIFALAAALGTVVVSLIVAKRQISAASQSAKDQIVATNSATAAQIAAIRDAATVQAQAMQAELDYLKARDLALNADEELKLRQARFEAAQVLANVLPGVAAEAAAIRQRLNATANADVQLEGSGSRLKITNLDAFNAAANRVNILGAHPIVTYGRLSQVIGVLNAYSGIVKASQIIGATDTIRALADELQNSIASFNKPPDTPI